MMNKSITARSSIIITGIILPLFFVACADSVSHQESQPEETILARIGDQTISVHEFIRRAEYTMRPEYCMRDNYIHKKIVLNSLIAEKLFAMEAGDGTALETNEEFQAFLKGRKEQAMRQWLQYVEAGKDVRVDTAEAETVFKQAGRTYQVRYVNIPEGRYQETYANKVRRAGDLSPLYQSLYGGKKVPSKEVTWQDASARPLHQALYGQPVQKNEILGPIRSVDGVITFLQVESWIDRKVISDAEIRERWTLVTERLTGYKTADRFDDFVSEVMAGKQLDFNPETFYALTEVFAPVYLRDKKEKEAMANAVFWNKKQDEEIFSSVREAMNTYRDYPLLKIDGEIWTVNDFAEAQKSHPLVFRSQKLNKQNFAKQFHLAIVDLVRDQYLNEEAYKRGYDKLNIVRRDVAMWRDQMKSLYHRNHYLKQSGFEGSFGTDYMEAIEEYLNPYVDSLQQKYSDQIAINYDVFESIALTRIDMFATLENVPYPVAVPSFPVLTTDHLLNYGDRIE